MFDRTKQIIDTFQIFVNLRHLLFVPQSPFSFVFYQGVYPILLTSIKSSYDNNARYKLIKISMILIQILGKTGGTTIIELHTVMHSTYLTLVA